MPAKFPQDSYDVIERMYGGVISQGFPKYAEFWELFIGRDTRSTAMKWYYIKFPRGYGAKQRKEFYRLREEVSMAHYSLFCNLAGAYFYFEELKTINIPINQENYFKHWEYFECFYLRLSGCFYQIFHLWDLLAKLVGETREHLLKKRRLLTHWKKFKEFHGRFSVLRDNLTHYSRGASKQLSDGFIIPNLVKEGRATKNKMELWSMQLKRKVWQRTDAKMFNDLVKCLQIFNYIHGFYIKEYSRMLQIKGLSIERN